MTQPVGIVGLGRIGSAAANAFLRDGYRVVGCDTNDAALRHFQTAGGIAAGSPKEVSMQADIVMILVLNDDQCTQVVLGRDGILESIAVSGTIICMSTIKRSTLELLARKCGERNIAFIDCPFTGGPGRIPLRALTLIAAAPQPVLESVRSVLEVLGRIVHVSTVPGRAQEVKHCNQSLVGATHAATMEVIALARKLDLDLQSVISVVSSGIAGSEYFRLLAESVSMKTPSPGSLGQMCKDMSIVKATLEDAGLDALVATGAWHYFAEAARLGMEERQGADLIEVVEKSIKHGINE